MVVLTVPPIAPAAPVLDPASDSGLPNFPNFTNDNQPFFDVTADRAGDRRRPTGANFVELLRSSIRRATLASDPNAADYVVIGQSLGTGQVQDGATSPVPDGVYDYVDRQVDVAGNIGAIRQPADVVTIETAQPQATTRPAARDPASDTGISDSDDITSATLIKFPVFDVSGVLAHATLELFRNGTLVNTLVTATASGR